ncbi:hypothetical protein BAU15_05315 [Enterococcus sp. JM4C]|jgi:hypothetical protein|uniref:DUF6275 family protein n=1 Tax=Candidatus Enterococcus huntleyi TaxID=1857217 RepID=UPI001379E8E1|nr:DUF6275 family protein [Enterococcus sp. JM4C]KAF1295172.1 hypothetical protein BAU15_05315 [Enterococcus sp. JM4C]
MDNNRFIEKCKDIIEARGIKRESIFVVWSCKTLQNNKAILSYAEKGAPLYELTHNGDKKEIYVDTYQKESNECVEV